MELNELNKQFEITRIEKLYETNNDMEHHYWYLVHLRIINKEHTKYKKIRYVIDFDSFEIQEYFEQEFYTKQNINEYKNELASNVVYLYLKDDIFHNCNELIEYAQNTINNYNSFVCNY
jgi:hypothetical protein